MRNVSWALMLKVFLLLPATSIAVERFDGNSMTKLTCPPKGNTLGYTWEFPATIRNSDFRAEHGAAGERGYLILTRKIAEDGNAKLTANRVVASPIRSRRIRT
ncbi:MAG: hypothetical protein WBX19_06875 [Terracidiphilus sp.]